MSETRTLDRKTIAFIGTGEMGKPMIRELLGAGFVVRCFDVFKENAEEVVIEGAIWTNTPRECAQGACIVCTCLPLPVHVRKQMEGPDGAIAGMSSGGTWIDTSTTDYHNTLEIADMLSAIGCFSLEAPVSNLSHMGVNFCNTSYLVAGDKQGWESAQAFLNTTGKISFYVGRIGMGQSAKLLTNDTFYTAVVHLGETFALLQEAGIPLHWFWDFVKQSEGNSVASDQFAPFLFDGSFDKSCTLLIAVKDMNLTCDMADELKLDLPISRLTKEAYNIAKERYDVWKGHIQVNRITEDDNGIKLRIPNFTAPSKYGVDTSYEHPPGLITDSIGRIKPELPHKYRSPPFEPTLAQKKIAEDACGFHAILNMAIYDEAVSLGVGMGVPEDTVREMVTWSVGTSWVSDHRLTYKPKRVYVDNMVKHVENSKLKYRWFHSVDAMLRRRNGW